MGVRVSVSDQVVLIGNCVFAENATTLFRQRVAERLLLDVGNRVRHYREINLFEWEYFDKRADELPSPYVEAAM